MKTALAIAALAVLSGSIVYAKSNQVDAVMECVHESPDHRYKYSYVVNECPTISTVEMECAVFDTQRKTVAKSHRSYEPDASEKPRWNRRCVVFDESGKHVFTRGEQSFSVTRAEEAESRASAKAIKVVDNQPCSQRVHAGGPRRLAALTGTRAEGWRW